MTTLWRAEECGKSKLTLHLVTHPSFSLNDLFCLLFLSLVFLVFFYMLSPTRMPFIPLIFFLIYSPITLLLLHLFSCDNVLPPLHPLSSSIFVVPGVYFSIAPSFLYCFFMSFSRFCSYCFSILFFHPLSSISFLNILFTSPCFHFPLCFLFSSIEFLLFSQLALIYYPLFSPIIPSSPTTIFSIYLFYFAFNYLHTPCDLCHLISVFHSFICYLSRNPPSPPNRCTHPLEEPGRATTLAFPCRT